MKKIESFEDRVTSLTLVARAAHGLENDRYTMSCGSSCVGREFDIFVFDKRTSEMVAYSSMKADYEPSIREFVEDYFA